MKIKYKLCGGFGVVLALLLCVIGIYQYCVKSTVGSVNDLMHVELEIAKNAAEVKSLILTSREHETNFVARRDKACLGALEGSIVLLQKKAGAIHTLARTAGYTASADKSKQIIALSQNYLNAFTEVVSAWERKGFDETTGLQGEVNSTGRGPCRANQSAPGRRTLPGFFTALDL